MKRFKTNLTTLVVWLRTSVTRANNYKSAFAGILLFLVSFQGQAQKSGAAIVRLDTSSAIEEKLVALALQGPEFKNVEHQNKISEYQLKGAQNAWLNLLAFSVNYNDQSFAKNPTTTYVYPKYYFGLTVPLGTILSKTQVKSARESVEIGKNNQEALRRKTREEVLTAYRQYRAYSELIAIQSELVNDVQAQLAQNEEKFRKGSITIEAYNAAQKSSNTEMASLINLRLQQDLKKLEIEKLIGVKLETVLNR